MKIADGIEPGFQELLRQATEWRLIGLLFERPREGWWQEVEDLCREVADAEIRAAADAAREEAGEGLYFAILGPGGAVSPREVAYRGMEDPGHILAAIKAFYEAFAFRPETEEPPDHVAVEAGFIGYLCLKEAFARARGDEEKAAIAARAAARFKQEHLSALAWSFAQRIEKTEVRYLSMAARALVLRSGPRPENSHRPEHPASPCDFECPLTCNQP
jgi:nitrate reductase assembly molybdenum cofactor insertion protein NarJ